MVLVKKIGDPDRIRTCDPEIRNLVLYPTELRDHFASHVSDIIFLNWGETNPATPSFHFTNK